MTKTQILRLNEADNIVVAITDLPPGSAVETAVCTSRRIPASVMRSSLRSSASRSPASMAAPAPSFAAAVSRAAPLSFLAGRGRAAYDGRRAAEAVGRGGWA